MALVILVRHGQTDENVSGRISGQGAGTAECAWPGASQISRRRFSIAWGHSGIFQPGGTGASNRRNFEAATASAYCRNAGTS